MAEFSSHPHGTPCWVDLSAPDPQAAKEFYVGVFGWDVEDQTDDDGNYVYTMFSKAGKTVAGLGGQVEQMSGMPAVWNSYVAVDDADAVLEKVEPAGGKIMLPAMDVFDAGRMAVIQDPSGAAISVWQAGGHIGAEIANEPDTYSWNELVTRDLDAARPFYEKVFGWQITTMDMPTGPYHVVAGGENNGLAGMMTMPDTMPERVPNHWAVYFSVADIEATMEKIKERGGTVTFGPEEVPGVGTLGGAHDPQYGAFSLMQHPSD